MRVAQRQTGITLFPEALKAAARKRLRQLIGFAVLAAVSVVALSLMTWTAGDPSLSHATNAPVRNAMGRPGAIIADLLMQLFGLGAMILLLVSALIGWRFVTHRRYDRESLRAPLVILATVLAAMTLSAMPSPGGWPLPTGMGGVIGDRALAGLSESLGGGAFLKAVVGLLSLGLAAIVSAFAAGWLWPQRTAADGEAPETVSARQTRRSVPMGDTEPGEGPFAMARGAFAHAVLSARARLKRASDDAPAIARAAAGYGPQATQRRAPRVTEDPVLSPPMEPTVVRREPSFEEELPTVQRSPRVHHVPPAGGPLPEVEAPRVAPQLTSPRSQPVVPDDGEPPFTPDPPRIVPDQPSGGPRIHAPAPTRVAAVQQKLPLPDPHGAHDGYELPPLDLLTEPRPSERHQSLSMEALQENAATLASTLDDFGVRGEIINVRPGPVVTLYELEPAPGTRSNRVIGLADDIARSMSAISARVALVPGRNAIGIELPNAKRETVLLREMLASPDFVNAKEKLPLVLGKNIGGDPIIADLAKMPHLLVAGTTGSGKSVAINTMILSLCYRLKPSECRLIMVDPKMLELSIYEGIPHLLTPVVTDPKKAVVALKWAVREMEERYKKMSKLGVRNIDGYNARAAQAKAKGEVLTRTVQTGFDRETGEAIYEQEDMGLDPMPYIVVIVDEMADLMLVAGKDIEGAIQRLAQMARAAGIHLIMATQRPSVDVITGTIKANFPTRISFQVTSKIDSRTILGEQGAEQLLGRGDMLHMAGGGRISRVHGPFVSDEEVEAVVNHLKMQGPPEYLDSVTVDDEEGGEEDEDGAVFDKGAFGEEPADLYDKALQIVMRDKKASTSYLQRRLGVGYNKAASLIERMEREGIVGPSTATGKRDILVGEGAKQDY